MRAVPPPLLFLLALDRLVARARFEDNNNEFVFVSFWGGVIVVEYRHARVDEEQGEGGHAGRGERA